MSACGPVWRCARYRSKKALTFLAPLPLSERRIAVSAVDSVARNAMRYFILGPLEVRDERGLVPLSGPKQRALVATLVLNANRPVSAERLAQALWGDEAPPRAVKRIHVHMSRL